MKVSALVLVIVVVLLLVVGVVVVRAVGAVPRTAWSVGSCRRSDWSVLRERSSFIFRCLDERLSSNCFGISHDDPAGAGPVGGCSSCTVGRLEDSSYPSLLIMDGEGGEIPDVGAVANRELLTLDVYALVDVAPTDITKVS